MNHQDSTKICRLRRLPAGLLVAGLMTALLLTGAGVCAAQEEVVKTDYGKISMGKGLFRSWCRTCHGDSAKGDGPTAEYLRPEPADLTLLSQKEGGQFYFGRVKSKIDGREKVRGHGSKEMPVWGDAFGLLDDATNEEAVRGKIDALAHYLQSIQAEAEDDGS